MRLLICTMHMRDLRMRMCICMSMFIWKSACDGRRCLLERIRLKNLETVYVEDPDESVALPEIGGPWEDSDLRR
jgi:hypothetical protein